MSEAWDQSQVINVAPRKLFRTLRSQVRAAPRHEWPPDGRVSILVRPTFSPQTAFAHNISTDSIGLLLSRPLEPGVRLALRLGSRDSPACRTVTAWVVHCTAWRGGWWLVGCRLSAPLTPAELEGLLAE
jgi:hypothetical protein